MSKLFIGTSGWSYAHWAEGVFYPKGLSQNKWLEYYAKFFNCVELNITFYRLVQKKTFQNWHKRTPKRFYFIAKGSRCITHIKRLKDCRDSLNLFFDNCLYLKEKLACVLWQLPAGYKKDLSRLEEFLKLLKKFKTRQTFEFRNIGWFDKEVYDLLRQHNSSLCIADSQRWPCPVTNIVCNWAGIKEITADFIYLRFHGRDGLYSGNYSDRELKDWAGFARATKRDVFAFFNNDAYGYAIRNALKFRELLEK